MREGQAVVGRQQTFTKDNVVVFIEGTLFMKIIDSHKSCYAIDQPLQSLTIAAQALVRAQVRRATVVSISMVFKFGVVGDIVVVIIIIGITIIRIVIIIIVVIILIILAGRFFDSR